MIEITIRDIYAGGRADKFLCKYLDKAPSSFVYKMMRKKNIVLNDKKMSGKELLQEGDCIKIYFSDETLHKFHSAHASENAASLNTAQIEPLILFEDEHLIALNKPCGMLSQKADRSDVSINELLVAYLNKQNASEAAFTPGISNRLDRNTSGIVLAGKDPAASRSLNEAIRTRKIGKFYWTVVSGLVQEPDRISGFLTKNKQKNSVRISKEKTEGASFIETAYEPLRSNAGLTLLEIDLITGKSHQIRAHFASIGHPVIGDPKYGDQKINQSFLSAYGLNHQFLHARKIVFQEMSGILSYLNGKELIAPLPKKLDEIVRGEHLWPHGAAEDCAESSSKN